MSGQGEGAFNQPLGKVMEEIMLSFVGTFLLSRELKSLCDALKIVLSWLTFYVIIYSHYFSRKIVPSLELALSSAN